MKRIQEINIGDIAKHADGSVGVVMWFDEDDIEIQTYEYSRTDHHTAFEKLDYDYLLAENKRYKENIRELVNLLAEKGLLTSDDYIECVQQALKEE